MNLKQDLDALGSLDVLIDNAAFVRVGRLEAISEPEIKTIVAIELRGPILPIRAAPIVAAFYTTYAAAKANPARFGEALRREQKSEGVHVLTAHPCGTDAPMTKSDRAGTELGFSRQPKSAVAEGIVAGVETCA
jgi:short-subunit dehydrogenase